MGLVDSKPLLECTVAEVRAVHDTCWNFSLQCLQEQKQILAHRYAAGIGQPCVMHNHSHGAECNEHCQIVGPPTGGEATEKVELIKDI